MVKRAWISSATFLVVAAALLGPQVAWAEPIRIGSIAREPAEEIKKFLPLASYLAKQLQPDGINQGIVVVARDIPEMAVFVRDGKVDLYIDSPFPSLAVSRLSGSKFLLRRWKKGIGEYHTVIFARKESDIRRLEDLRGRIIALERPFSSSGYFLPKLVLAQAGLAPAAKREFTDPVGAGEVGYVFSGGDENTMVWVLRGKVAAGAMDNQNYLEEAKGSLDHLRVIHRTFSLPRQVVSYRGDLSARLVGRIKEILLQMDRSEGGKKALRDFELTTRFDEIPSGSMAPLLHAQDLIAAELGLR